MQQEALGHRVSLRLDLAPTLPAVLGDRVQLQQVVINLIVNGMEAMAPVTDRPRQIVVRSRVDDSDQVLGRGRKTSWVSGIEPGEMPSGSSMPSSPPNPAEWAWGCRSAARSSRTTVGGYGLRAMPGLGPHFNSPCSRITRSARDLVDAGMSVEGYLCGGHPLRKCSIV